MLTSFSPTTLNPTLAVQIADQIGAAIIEEQFTPGERIHEVKLANMFNVSRSTVRDALRILESRGLISMTPQRGARVKLLSIQELHNLFEIRAVLLALASRRAAGNYQLTDDPLLKAALAELKQSMSDSTAYSRASAAMVSQVSLLSGSEQLTEMIASFAQRIGRYARLGLVTQKRREQSFANWKTLVAAIRERDQDLAETTHRRLAQENREAAMTEIEMRARVSVSSGRPKTHARKP